MKRIFPVAGLATVLVACAHHPADQHSGDVASAGRVVNELEVAAK